jgi:hypothetical protein
VKCKKPSFRAKEGFEYGIRKQILLISQSCRSAGIGTLSSRFHGRLVAGHHRASPSASLDKKFAIHFLVS